MGLIKQSVQGLAGRALSMTLIQPGHMKTKMTPKQMDTLAVVSYFPGLDPCCCYPCHFCPRCWKHMFEAEAAEAVGGENRGGRQCGLQELSCWV